MRKLYYWLAVALSAVVFTGEMRLDNDYSLPSLVFMVFPAVGIAISLLAISEPFVMWRRGNPIKANRERIFFDPWPGAVGTGVRLFLIGTFVVDLVLGLFFFSEVEVYQRFMLVNGAVGIVLQIVWALLEWQDRKKGWDSPFHWWWTSNDY